MRITMIFFAIFIGSKTFAIVGKWDSNQLDWTPLMKAAYNNDIPKIRYLLIEGYDINQQNDKGWSALIVAIKHGKGNAVKYLLRNHANPNLCDTLGYSPLLHACESKKSNIVRLLCVYGANTTYQIKGWSPLMSSTVNGNRRMMKMLIKKGAPVNTRRLVDSMTALGLASYYSFKSYSYKRKYQLLKKSGGIL